MRNTVSRLVPFLSVVLMAQVPVAPPAAKAPDLADAQPDILIDRATVSVVQVPVTVTDRTGSLANGLQANEFHLFDNGKDQDIRVDIASQPISVVIAIQCSDRTDAILKQIKKAGNVFGPQVIGEDGEAAVLAFDHRIREMQSFTNDAQKITSAINKISAGSTSARLIDAVDKAVYMLRSRPVTRRKIVLLVSENRDQASEGKLRETLIDAQLSNVTVYTINISRIATNLTAAPDAPTPIAQPATAYSMPGGAPSTPLAIQQKTGSNGRAEFVPLFKEIYKDAKGIFVAPPNEVFTHETGGAQFSFLRERGLQEAIQRISDEVHTQYIISYNPNNKTEGGFHEVEVRLDRTDLRVRARPGYYLASLGK